MFRGPGRFKLVMSLILYQMLQWDPNGIQSQYELSSNGHVVTPMHPLNCIVEEVLVGSLIHSYLGIGECAT